MLFGFKKEYIMILAPAWMNHENSMVKEISWSPKW
jgi:hypothetical protein